MNTMSGTICKFTHEFRQDNTLAHGSSYVSAVRAALGITEAIDDKRVLGAINRGTSLSPTSNNLSLDSDNDVKFRKLALACKVEIRLVHVTATPDQQKRVDLRSYGADSSKDDRCIYILYDEASKCYKPLYMSLKSNHAQQTTIFDRNNKDILIILEAFVRDDLHDPTFADQYGDTSTAAADESGPTLETSNIADLLAEDSLSNDEFQISVSGLPYPTPASDANTNVINQKEARRIDRLLRASFLHLGDQTPTAISGSNSNPPIDSLSSTTTYASAEVPISLETGVISGFRGRTGGQYKPKKALKRNGQIAHGRDVTYFADRNNKHVLTLLIWQQVLSELKFPGYLEVCMITNDIDGGIFIHPYFKFQMHRTDKNVPDQNPIYIPLDNQHGLIHLNQYISKLQMQLVVIMLTNPKLIKNQPMKLFNSPTLVEPIGIRVFKCHREFKSKCQLNSVRFTFTLCEKDPRNPEYHRLPQIQYISPVSRQDKKWKKPQYTA